MSFKLVQQVPKMFDESAVLTLCVKLAGESLQPSCSDNKDEEMRLKSASVGDERCGQLMR